MSTMWWSREWTARRYDEVPATCLGRRYPASRGTPSSRGTTYGAPFYDLDAVSIGDEIVVETVIGTHVYEVRSVQVVAPTAVEVTYWRPGA